MFKIGVFGIILDKDKRVLLCHRRDHNLWNLPGGGMEKDETPWEAVIREVKEEVGVEVKVIKLIGVYSKPENNEVVFSFLCKKNEGEVSLSDEADQINYFSINELPRNISPKQVERIKDALDGKTETVLKIQKGPSSIDLLKQGKLI